MIKQRLAGVLALAVLIHASLSIWVFAHNQHVFKASSEAAVAIDRVAQPVLPTKPEAVWSLSCVTMDDEPRYLAWNANGSPFRLAMLASAPMTVPTFGTGIPVGDGVFVNIPVALVSFALWLGIIIIFADRYRKTKAKHGSSFQTAVNATIQSLAFTIWVPFALAFGIAFWDNLFNQTTGGYLTAAATSRGAILGVTAGFLAIYPLTLMWMRWRSHAKADLASDQPKRCVKCDFTIDALAVWFKHNPAFNASVGRDVDGQRVDANLLNVGVAGAAGTGKTAIPLKR